MENRILREFIIRSIGEDLGDGDHSSLACIPWEATGKANLLIKEAQDRGEQIEPYIARQLARVFKTTAQMNIDILKDKMKPFEKVVEVNETQRIIAQKDAEWYASHPDFEARKAVMQVIIKESYPDGIPNGVDPYVVGDMAYKFADKFSANAKKAIEDQNNKRIAAGRSLNSVTQGTVSSQISKPKPKLNAIATETEKLLEQVIPTLMKSK